MRNKATGSGTGRTLAEMGGQEIFAQWVQAHEGALRSYCRSLAGSAWEGDDLAQDTWLKIWSVMRNKGQEFHLTRTYLYQTARHAWIDRGRKKTLPVQPALVDELPQQHIDSALLWTAMETLVGQLAPIQRTALLLIDIMQYTAAEAAELVQSTEGAVKAALHRARVKLRDLLKQPAERKGNGSSRLHDPESEEAGPNRAEGTYGLNESVVYAYLEAFRRQDAAALAMLLNDARPHEVVPVLTLQSYRHVHVQPGKGTHTTSEPVQSRMMSMSYAA
ncbi:RNA polymerase sigma factor [Paenibacillus macerans]|uniref:RNA polymerase sigma factor n=1 Tax=Paenibacillus macerans TaxID=44252 RepID=UPI003D322F01